MSAPLQHPVGHIQKVEPPRTSKELACRRRQEVTMEPCEIDWQLAHRLAGIDQIRDLGVTADLSNLVNRLHQTRISGYPGERHESGATLAHQLPHRVGIDSSF